MPKESPSQTAGPYLHIGCLPTVAGLALPDWTELGTALFTGPAVGTRIAITGRVLDGSGTPVTDAMVEIWQADADGRYSGAQPSDGATPGFTGWGRQATDAKTGAYRFETIKPGRVPSSLGLQAPHISVWVVARGINLGLNTRIYFADEAAANAADPVLQSMAGNPRIKTLMATQNGDAYSFDIHLQGDDETIFFDI